MIYVPGQVLEKAAFNRPYLGARYESKNNTLEQNQREADADVEEEIRSVLGQDQCMYGYHIMMDELRVTGF